MVYGPYVSVRPYTWIGRIFSSPNCSSKVGEGGAPATVTFNCLPRRCAFGWLTRKICTVGAPLKCVTPSDSNRSHTRPGSIARRHTCVPPTAVTAQVKHHPLQWNIGSVHK